MFLNTILASPPSYERGLEMTGLVMRLQARDIVILRILADPRRLTMTPEAC